MNVAVVLRLVPDLSEELELNNDGTDLDRELTGVRLNEFDEHALEESILIKERHGASVTAVAIDRPGVERALRGAIARGADAAILLKSSEDEDAFIDAWRAVPMLAEALGQLDPRLVLTGVQTEEDFHGQLAPLLGSAMKLPHASAVTDVKVTEDRISFVQEYGSGQTQRLSTAGSAVLGVQSASQPPRYVSGSKMREAMSGDGLSKNEPDTDLQDQSNRVVGLSVPDRGYHAEILATEAEDGADRVLEILRAKGVLG